MNNRLFINILVLSFVAHVALAGVLARSGVFSSDKHIAIDFEARTAALKPVDPVADEKSVEKPADEVLSPKPAPVAPPMASVPVPLPRESVAAQLPPSPQPVMPRPAQPPVPKPLAQPPAPALKPLYSPSVKPAAPLPTPPPAPVKIGSITSPGGVVVTRSTDPRSRAGLPGYDTNAAAPPRGASAQGVPGGTGKGPGGSPDGSAAGSPYGAPGGTRVFGGNPGGSPSGKPGGTGKSPAPAVVKPAVKPKPAANVDLDKIRKDYAIKVTTLIESRKKLPEQARQRGIQGNVRLSFTIGAGGALAESAVAGSSNESILDEAALATLRSAGPFPPLPRELGVERLKLAVTLKYVITKK